MQRPGSALILIASLLSFLTARPVLAGPIEDSVKAYRRGDFKTAYQLIKPEAEKGDAAAQFILGYLYDEGKGIPKDYAEAAKWYGRAANQGNKAARHNLGLMGDQDQVSKDRAEMEKWHRSAVDPATAAASNLGLTEDQGRGIPKANSEMGKWHRSAAEPETASAPSDPGLTEDQGRGVPKANAEMEKWHRRATE